MRKTATALTAIIALVFCAHLAAYDIPALQHVPVISGTITLDGKLDEAGWKKAVEIDDFTLNRHPGKTPLVKTSAYLIANKNLLYIAFKCEDKAPAKLVANITNNNGPLWQDDSVETFIDPGHKFTSLIHFIVNTKNTLWQQGSGALYSKAKNFGLKARSAKGKNFYIVEMSVPLDQVGLSLSAQQKGEQSVFRVNFARNVMNPASLPTGVKRMDLCASKSDYFDRKGFHKFIFTGAEALVRIKGATDDLIINQRRKELILTASAETSIQYAWYQLYQSHGQPPRKPRALWLKAGAAENLILRANVFSAGDFVYRLAVSENNRVKFVRDFVFRLDEPITIAPDFPCRSLNSDEKKFRLIVAPYVLSGAAKFKLGATLKKRYLVIKDWNFAELRTPTEFSITTIFNGLEPGAYTLTAYLEKNGKTCYANEYVFHKGLTNINRLLEKRNGKIVIPNWNFEETTSRRPRLWRVDDKHTGNTLYPQAWGQRKKAEFWCWGDLKKFPQSIYEGKGSLILKGYGPGAQLHLGSRKFIINTKKRYQAMITACGKGVLSARFYIKNKKGKWMGKYYDTRKISLTNNWISYVFDPVMFDQPINHDWGGKSLGDDNIPYSASLVIWLHDAGLAYIDNAALIEW